MALSAGAASASSANASQYRVLSRRHYTRRVHRHYHMTSHWNRYVNANHRLTGKYAITNKPDILRGAHVVVSAHHAKGARVYSTRGRMYNHTYKYWYVIVKNGHYSGRRGWINARGVHYSKARNRKRVAYVYVPKNNKQYTQALMDIVKAQTEADAARTYSINSPQFNVSAGSAKDALAQAKGLVGKIGNKADKKAVADKISNTASTINSVVNGKKSNYDNSQSALSAQVNQDLQVAHGYLVQAQHASGSERAAVIGNAKRAIGNAKLYNGRISNGATERANNTSIETMSDYAQAVESNHERSHAAPVNINAREDIAASKASADGIKAGKASINEWNNAAMHSGNFAKEVQSKVTAHRDMDRLSNDLQTAETAKRLATNSQVKNRIQGQINTLKGYVNRIAKVAAHK